MEKENSNLSAHRLIESETANFGRMAVTAGIDQQLIEQFKREGKYMLTVPEQRALKKILILIENGVLEITSPQQLKEYIAIFAEISA